MEHTTLAAIMDVIRLFFAYTDFMSGQDRDRHRIYMSFMLRGQWYCQFLEEDLQTPLPRKLRFASPDIYIVEINRSVPPQQFSLIFCGDLFFRGFLIIWFLHRHKCKLLSVAKPGEDRTDWGVYDLKGRGI